MLASLDVVLDRHGARHVLAFVHLSESALPNQLQQLDFPLLDDKLKVSPFFQKLIQFSDFHSPLPVQTWPHCFFTSQFRGVLHVRRIGLCTRKRTFRIHSVVLLLLHPFSFVVRKDKQSLRIHGFEFEWKVFVQEDFIVFFLVLFLQRNVPHHAYRQAGMAGWRAGFLTFVDLIELLKLIDSGFGQRVDLVWVKLHPFFCFVVFGILGTWVSLFVFFFLGFFWIHPVKDLIGLIQLILFLDDVTLIDVSCFEFRWLVAFAKWMRFSGFWSQLSKHIGLSILFFLFFLMNFTEIFAVIGKPFAVSQLHWKIVFHLFLCDCNQTFARDFVFVEHFFVFGQIYNI